jgi:hypothetical protein
VLLWKESYHVFDAKDSIGERHILLVLYTPENPPSVGDILIMIDQLVLD